MNAKSLDCLYFPFEHVRVFRARILRIYCSITPVRIPLSPRARLSIQPNTPNRRGNPKRTIVIPLVLQYTRTLGPLKCMGVGGGKRKVWGGGKGPARRHLPKIEDIGVAPRELCASRMSSVLGDIVVGSGLKCGWDEGVG